MRKLTWILETHEYGNYLFMCLTNNEDNYSGNNLYILENFKSTLSACYLISNDVIQ